MRSRDDQHPLVAAYARTERALRESEARLEALFETAVDGMIIIDPRGSIVMFNPACERLFGFSAAEALGHNVAMLMPEPDHSAHDGYIARHIETGERRIIGIGREVRGRKKDGTIFPMHLSVGEAKQDGESLFVGILHDLTERKTTEAQLVQAQKMEAVGQLSGGIAHDFNNLLTVVVGNAELLVDMLSSRPDLQKIAEAIVQAGERGAELTQRLLAFSRRQTLQPTEVDCNRLVKDMEKLLGRMLGASITVRAVTENGLWTAYADPGQLENALLNLAINARDAMPAGGSLTLSTSNMPLDERYRDHHPEVNPGLYVMVAVTDDGTGMSPEVLARAFEPFYTTKDIGKGTGLGLSMVYGFVKQSNGHVAIYSEPGLGTTVRLYLPAVAAEAGAVAGEAPPLAEAPRRETILIAEDDPFVRSYAVTCLTTLGYVVVETSDAREALRKLGDGVHADLLFTDIVMPGGMTGWELAQRARQMRPDLRVLMTSGYALEALAEAGRLPVGAHILNKPYRKADLAKSLREALAG
jgi:PAS domain S-box-containing protein